MKILKVSKLKFLLWLVDYDKAEIITEEEEGWLCDSHTDKGFQSYCKVRNIEILKQIAIAVQKRDLQRALELNGQRLEILKLQARAQTQFKKKNLL